MRDSLKLGVIAAIAMTILASAPIGANAAANGAGAAGSAGASGAAGAAGGSTGGGAAGGGATGGGGSGGGFNPAGITVANDPPPKPRRPGHHYGPKVAHVGGCGYVAPVFDRYGDVIGYRSVYQCY